MTTISVEELPGANCGLCGFRTCGELAGKLETNPSLIKRCVPFSSNNVRRLRDEPSGDRDTGDGRARC